MEDGLIEFHHYHRRSKGRRKGVVHAIICPYTRNVGIGWSMCNHARGDVFDPPTGRDIARRRALKHLQKQNSGTVLHLQTNTPGSKTGWKIYGAHASPVTLASSVDKLMGRIERVLHSVDMRNYNTTFVGDDDHTKGIGNPIL